MKGNAKNFVGYTGIVTISQYTNGKKFIISKTHNNGNTPLFEFFADCLLGEFAKARTNLPEKICLIKASEAGMATEGSGFIYLRSNPIKQPTANKECIVKYSFIVPREVLEAGTYEKIRLYRGSATTFDDYSAEVLANLNPSDWSDSSVLVIDWELIISNVGSAE